MRIESLSKKICGGSFADVGNLAWETEKEDLTELFAKFGQVILSKPLFTYDDKYLKP